MIDDLGTPEAPRSPIEKRFWDFHLANPHVYELFDRFTKYAINRGRSNFSARVVLERIRWETTIETTSPEGFKLNNNHSTYYARLWMRENPQFDGFFRTRIVNGSKEGFGYEGTQSNGRDGEACRAGP